MLIDGATVLIRPATPGDEDIVRQMHERAAPHAALLGRANHDGLFGQAGPHENIPTVECR